MARGPKVQHGDVAVTEPALLDLRPAAWETGERTNMVASAVHFDFAAQAAEVTEKRLKINTPSSP